MALHARLVGRDGPSRSASAGPSACSSDADDCIVTCTVQHPDDKPVEPARARSPDPLPLQAAALQAMQPAAPVLQAMPAAAMAPQASVPQPAALSRDLRRVSRAHRAS